MPQALIFRQALPGDARALSRLAVRSKGHWGYSAEFMRACRAELTVAADAIADRDSYFEIALDDAELAGYCALEGLSGDEIELSALFVDPRHIGKGVGRQLIEHAKLRARNLGASSLVIQSDPHALAFYQAAGGVVFAESASGSIPGRMLPMLRIALQADGKS